VYVFLAAFVLTSLAHLEAWPFTGFRLFSELRSSEVQLWRIAAVSSDGSESTVHLGELPVAYRTTNRVIDGFDAMTRRERDKVCDGWMVPLRERGDDVVGVRVYSSTRSVRPDAPAADAELAYECGTPP
jgi:hypothetical protein